MHGNMNVKFVKKCHLKLSSNRVLTASGHESLTELNWTELIYSVKPKSNSIQRKSTDSSLTIPFERTFRELQANRPSGGAALEDFNFCGCGWPQHMLLPKGTPEGMPCELFVMISNFDDDKVSP